MPSEAHFWVCLRCVLEGLTEGSTSHGRGQQHVGGRVEMAVPG